MKLKDFCVLDVETCTRDMTVAAAAQLMRERHAGDLVVINDPDDEREPIGIVTDRDIVVEVVARGRDPARTQVGEIMSSPIVIASESEELAQALERMATHGVRRIPVVDDAGAISGIVALDDALKAHAEQTSRLLDAIAKERNREQRTRR
jgi:CBS domain-containing protein